MTKGVADSCGAIARIPLREGFEKSAKATARLIVESPEMHDLLLRAACLLHKALTTPVHMIANLDAESVIQQINDLHSRIEGES